MTLVRPIKGLVQPDRVHRAVYTDPALFELEMERLFGFLAVDKTRLQDLDEAARRYLAWESILAEKETLDLLPHQVKQAETQETAADSAMTARIPEAYQWLLVPVQESPQGAVRWQAFRLSGQDTLAVRASKKLRTDEEASWNKMQGSDFGGRGASAPLRLGRTALRP